MSKITPDHLGRTAVVYVRQSTMAQVMGNLESQRRQYELAAAAKAAGFASVTVIDDDLGRSGSGSVERPGFERLVALVCSGEIGAVYCIEASRLARNGRDWHHLIDLCALTGALVIDPDGAYDPRIVNDRLLLGLKGTMSEYELSLMRQRGLVSRNAKAQRGEFRFMLPPGFCWGETGKVEKDPDEHVQEAVRLVFTRFRELGSARQVFLWLRDADIKMPVVRRNVQVTSSSGKPLPIIQWFRFCIIRSMLAFMHSVAMVSARRLMMVERARPTATSALARNGRHFCVIITKAISVGRNSKRMSGFFLRMPT